MDFLRLVKDRESCRDYTKKAIAKADLAYIVEAARLAPSATNQQPWHFYVVMEEEKRNTLAKALQKFNKDAGAFIVIVEDQKSLGVRALEKVKRQMWTAYDIGIVASHIVHAATSLKLGSCILGWFSESKVRRVLGLEKKAKVRLIVSLGYKTVDGLRDKKRKAVEEVTTWI